ncbi:MAG: methionyl-tRNA formyltransferase [Gammaproteobacteria bacterium]|nr:methionyl-tRNA formyltransferase [Gammaproteobacteria bacterium]
MIPPADRLRIVFAGTPEFAVPPLEALIGGGFRPLAVLTQPDRPAGRGRRLQASPVKRTAERAGIPVHQPSTLRTPEAAALLESLGADLLVVVAYGLILPANILSLPRHGCWNIHASLLPRWRGAAPIQRTIEAGDSESGICVMQMDEGLDTGPVIRRRRLALTGRETGGELHDRLASEGAETLLACVRQLARGEPPEAQPQASEGVTYATKLDKREARIRWQEPATAIERRIRAFDPWPVAWCLVGDERTRVWRSVVVRESHHERPGAVLEAGPQGIEVATGDGALRLTELQPPGKRRMAAADYLNARRLPPILNGADPETDA